MTPSVAFCSESNFHEPQNALKLPLDGTIFSPSGTSLTVTRAKTAIHSNAHASSAGSVACPGAEGNVAASCSGAASDTLIQVMLQYRGITRGLDTMWRHMGVETNMGHCLYPEEATFLQQAVS